MNFLSFSNFLGLRLIFVLAYMVIGLSIPTFAIKKPIEQIPSDTSQLIQKNLFGSSIEHFELKGSKLGASTIELQFEMNKTYGLTGNDLVYKRQGREKLAAFKMKYVFPYLGFIATDTSYYSVHPTRKIPIFKSRELVPMSWHRDRPVVRINYNQKTRKLRLHKRYSSYGFIPHTFELQVEKGLQLLDAINEEGSSTLLLRVVDNADNIFDMSYFLYYDPKVLIEMGGLTARLEYMRPRPELKIENSKAILDLKPSGCNRAIQK